MEDEKGKLVSCLLIPRKDQDGPMFFSAEDGRVVCNLERYAIVPREDYERLKGLADESWRVMSEGPLPLDLVTCE